MRFNISHNISREESINVCKSHATYVTWRYYFHRLRYIEFHCIPAQKKTLKDTWIGSRRFTRGLTRRVIRDAKFPVLWKTTENPCYVTRQVRDTWKEISKRRRWLPIYDEKEKDSLSVLFYRLVFFFSALNNFPAGVKVVKIENSHAIPPKLRNCEFLSRDEELRNSLGLEKLPGDPKHGEKQKEKFNNAIDPWNICAWEYFLPDPNDLRNVDCRILIIRGVEIVWTSKYNNPFYTKYRNRISRVRWYLFSPNAKRRRRPFESAPLHFLPHGWLKIAILRQAWWSKESRSMHLTRRKYPDWRCSIYFEEAITRRFRERINKSNI